MGKEQKKAKQKDGERMEEPLDINEEDIVTESAQKTSEMTDEAVQLKKELDDLKETHLRLHADFDNFRKRAVKEKYVGGFL